MIAARIVVAIKQFLLERRNKIDKELLRHFKETGHRPTAFTHRDQNHWLMWNMKSSVSIRCDELGMPIPEMPEIDADLVAYFKETGKRPTALTHPNLNQWLVRNHHSSIAQRCDALNLDVAEAIPSLEQIDKILLDHFNTTGHRPTSRSHSHVDELEHNLEHILGYYYNTSIAKRCDHLKIPVAVTYTLEQIDQDLLAFHKQTGKCPTKLTHVAFDSWLRRHDSSVAKRCQALGIAPSVTLEQIDQAIVQFHKETGKRPTKLTFPAFNQWLVRNHKTTISMRCNELNLS